MTPTKSEISIIIKDPLGKTYWNGTLEYKSEMTAYSVLLDTLGAKNIDAGGDGEYGYDGVYVRAIRDDDEDDGWFGEFDRGSLSGWMYCVNGVFPMYSSSLYKLKSGDEVEWLYTRDLGIDLGVTWMSEGGGPGGGPSGGGAGIGGAAGSAETTLAPKVTVKNGAAEVSIKAPDMDKAIAGAKKSGGKAIIIKPDISGKAVKTSVELAKASLAVMVSDTEADLKIVTPAGSAIIPNNALTGLVSQASGSTITMSLESVDTSSMTPAQRGMVANKLVYDISIISGGSPVTSFNGNAITISLPYTLKSDESASNVKVWHMNSAGELEQMACSYDEKTGLATFKTVHLSYYLVGVETTQSGFTMSFTDVKNSDWFYEAVRFAVEKDLFKGTTETTFSPNEPMTRAMLVTVLHRLEGSPVTTDANNFIDVENNEWFTNAVIWANANAVVSGYGNGRFGSNEPLTREQMAVILYRYAQMKAYNVTKTTELMKFTDTASISNWAESAMKWAVAEGLISGTTATELEPKGIATRAQVAAILQRFIEKLS